MSVQEVIKSGVVKAFSKNRYLSPDIPERKLNNALKKIASNENPDHVVALFDNSLLADGKEGIVFMGTKLFYRTMLSSPISIEYDEIKEAEFIEKEIKKEKKNGDIKISVENVISITKKDGSLLEMTGLANCDYTHLVELFTQIADIEEEYSETSQAVTLSEMNSDVKLSYLKIIINMTFFDDDEIDAQEYAEIISLITRIEFTPEERVILRAYMSDDQNKELNKDLLNTIVTNCPDGNEKSIHISLTKDLLIVFKTTKKGKAENFDFLQKNRDILNVTDEEIELVEQAIENDLKLINDKIPEKKIQQNLKELSAKAGAVGVPIAALYMTGTVGFSAAGITSGLAALGMGGVLGFSSMVTGVGVAVLIGVGTYKGVKKLTGTKEIEQQKRREFLLQGVIKHTQMTINILVEDVKYISNRLVKAIEQGEIHSVQIQKLAKTLTLLSNTGTILTEKSEYVENQAVRTKCPEKISPYRLKSLASDPTKQKYYEAVLICYEEVPVDDDDIDDDGAKTKLLLKNDLPTKTIKTLVDILDAIGYFSVSSIAKGAAKDLGKKASDKLGNLFNAKK